MQIKNKKKILVICFLNLFLFNLNLIADEFNISAKEITIDNKNQILINSENISYLYPNGHRITHQMRWFKASIDNCFKPDIAA